MEGLSVVGFSGGGYRGQRYTGLPDTLTRTGSASTRTGQPGQWLRSASSSPAVRPADPLQERGLGHHQRPRREITGNTTRNIQLTGDVIGTTTDGTGSVANSRRRRPDHRRPRYNTIGGTAAGTGNVISGNTQNGVEIRTGIEDTMSSSSNIIGLDSSGSTSALPKRLERCRDR